MAAFYNQATLSYGGNISLSNITTGEIIDVYSMTKNAIPQSYTSGSAVTFVLSILNTGATSLSNLTVTDNLGSYSVDSRNVTPLDYTEGSIRYYINGILQNSPTISSTDPLTITGINLPAGGNAMLIYETIANRFAPPGTTGTITNRATVTGTGLNTALEASAVIPANAAPVLSINKSLSPLTVAENGQITYTFVIENTGSVAADSSYNVSISDVFNPILNSITVTLNGTPLSLTTGYTYDTDTGNFATVEGQITVPAATYSQDTDTGVWNVTPGVSTLVVTGTL